MITTKLHNDRIRIQFDSEEEWLQHRKGIGGSDASAVLGMNPYKNNVELWKEKCKMVVPEDISDKPYVIYGKKAEEYLRNLFALDFPEYTVEYYDNNMIKAKEYPFMHASLDGELIDKDGRRGILEIKTTNILQSMQREKWNEKIPDNYYIQVLHYLLDAGSEYQFAILKAQLKSEWQGELRISTKHYFIERKDVEEDIELLKCAEFRFWEHVLNRKEPDLILPEI